MPRRRELDPSIERLGSRLLTRTCDALGTNLRRSRLAAGKTQEQLAEEIGVSTIYLQGLERGRGENPTLRVLALLANALDASVSELLDESPPLRVVVRAVPRSEHPLKPGSRVRRRGR